MDREHGRRAAPSRRAPKQRKRRRRALLRRLPPQQRILVVIAVILAVALVVVVACQSLFERPDIGSPGESHGGDPQSGPTEIDYGDGVRPFAGGERKSKDYYSILVLGRDTGGGGNTDTMLLASYDVTNQKATVMSIPRDTMVNVDWDVKKINSVYNWYGGGEKGIQALYKEIAQLVGFEPDFRVVVEWDAVGEIVDAIGGVYFDVPYEMDYFDPAQDLRIRQTKGYRLLTGDDAMQVIRWRKNSPNSPYGNTTGIGDDGRIKVQQDFLKATIQQLMTPSNVLNIGKIASVFQNCVETDLSFQEILWFGQQAVSGGLSVESVEFITLPFEYASAFSRTESKRLEKPIYLSYVVPVADELLQIVNEKLSPFKEVFTRSQLDIMSVNSDGSLSSTSGYVEDTTAALPPDLSPYEEEESEFFVDENGDLIDPESGEVLLPGVIDPETGEILIPGVIDPETGEITLPGESDPETSDPEPSDRPTTPNTTPETQDPVDPDVPTDTPTETPSTSDTPTETPSTSDTPTETPTPAVPDVPAELPEPEIIVPEFEFVIIDPSSGT